MRSVVQGLHVGTSPWPHGYFCSIKKGRARAGSELGPVHSPRKWTWLPSLSVHSRLQGCHTLVEGNACWGTDTYCLTHKTDTWAIKRLQKDLLHRVILIGSNICQVPFFKNNQKQQVCSTLSSPTGLAHKDFVKCTHGLHSPTLLFALHSDAQVHQPQLLCVSGTHTSLSETQMSA